MYYSKLPCTINDDFWYWGFENYLYNNKDMAWWKWKQFQVFQSVAAQAEATLTNFWLTPSPFVL